MGGGASPAEEGNLDIAPFPAATALALPLFRRVLPAASPYPNEDLTLREGSELPLCDLSPAPFPLWAHIPSSREGLPALAAGASNELVLTGNYY